MILDFCASKETFLSRVYLIRRMLLPIETVKDGENFHDVGARHANLVL